MLGICGYIRSLLTTPTLHMTSHFRPVEVIYVGRFLQLVSNSDRRDLTNFIIIIYDLMFLFRFSFLGRNLWRFIITENLNLEFFILGLCNISTDLAKKVLYNWDRMRDGVF